jgi:hypothetical protein
MNRFIAGDRAPSSPEGAEMLTGGDRSEIGLILLQISSLEALNAQVRRWMEQVANVRVHRETGKRPCDAFEQEKPTLQRVFEKSCQCQVHRRGTGFKAALRKLK